MKHLLFTTLLIAFLSHISQAIKVLTINDIHLDVNNTDQYSVPGTEASITTLEKVLQEAAEAEKGEKIDAILLIGDMCRHGLAADVGATENNWEMMKYTMREALKAIVAAFPDVPIVPVIGNNDVVYHDQAPLPGNDHTQYYSDTWSIFFKEVPANAAMAANSTIEGTWMSGGWYVYEIAPDVMIINLNGMYPFYENWTDRENADNMLAWVE